MPRNTTKAVIVVAHQGRPLTASVTAPRALAIAGEWDQIIQMWLHGRPESTVAVYTPEIEAFRRRVPGKRLAEVTLLDLQNWAVDLAKQKPRTVARKLSTIKSLLSFAHRAGVIPLNVGAVLRAPKIPSDLAEKILPETAIQKLIRSGADKRDNAMLRLMYVSGIRASEVAGLRWVDCQSRWGGGQITVLGKGNKTRSIKVSRESWAALMEIKPRKAQPEDPVFVSRWGKAFDRTGINVVVAAAAARAGLEAHHVSPHWLRHAHATHSLDRGAPLLLIQQTLGHASLATTQKYLHAHPEDSSSRFLKA